MELHPVVGCCWPLIKVESQHLYSWSCNWKVFSRRIILKRISLWFRTSLTLTSLTLSPTAYQILWLLQGGGLRDPPKISRKEASLTPCCYITFICFIFRGYMQKCRQKYQNKSKISEFQILWNWYSVSHWRSKNCYNFLDFEDTGLESYM